jgi:nucleoside-diphosphate-sugar epimerase
VNPTRSPSQRDARLRTKHGPEGAAHEKLDVEREVMAAPAAGTVVRYPAVYGPGDRRRMTHYVRRMMDGRPFVLLDEAASPWRFSRGFSRNVGAAVALATVSPQAAGQIYNIADPSAFSEREWIEEIGVRVGWSGAIIEVPGDQLPAALRHDLDFRQHWVVDSTRVRVELGFEEPTPTTAAVTATVEWELAHPPKSFPVDYAAEDDVATGL